MTIKEEYKKERKRILDYLSRARREGYQTQDVVVPPIPKKITAGSVRRLKKIDAKYLSHTIQGYYAGALVSRTKKKFLEAKERTEKRRARRKWQKELEEARKVDEERRQKRLKEIEEQNKRFAKEKEQEKQRRLEWEKNITEIVESGDYNIEPDDYSDIILDRFFSYMLGYPKPIYNIIIDSVNRAIQVYGESPVAAAINRVGDKVERFLSGIYGQSEREAQQFATEILNSIPGVSHDDQDLIEQLIEGY